MAVDDQPLAGVEWVECGTLHANDYNPNHVAPIELKLLKTSILEDGWTQPIVCRDGGEIVDGFHRWTLASTDPQVRTLTDGLVPVVRLRGVSDAQQRMATIRHNRARGSHYVVRMADIVETLVNEHGVTEAEVSRRLGMDSEEVERLLDHGVMVKRGAADEIGKAWEPSYEDQP